MIRCAQKTARTHDRLSSWHLSSPKVISQPMTALAHTSESDCRTRTTSEHYTANESWTRTKYAYDKASNRTSFTDPESGSTAYVYDTLNRLQTLTPPAAISGGSFGFGYDGLSRRTSLTRPNAVNTAYSYDNLSRLLSVTHANGGVTLDGASYGLDNAENRTSKSDLHAGVTTNYGYDNIYELLSATQGASTTESYTFDPVGNRLTSIAGSWSNNTSNELTSSPTATYTYDNNGNTATKVDSTGTTTYAWDFENRLTTVTLPGSGGTVSFRYDPFGRRIYKSSSSGTSVYAYDGDNLVEETNSSGSVVARYAQSLTTDEPLAMLRSGATSFYHADGLGSVTSLSNSSGSVANTYTYDSFGKLTASTGSVVNPFQFTSREMDSETMLYYMRARNFDPTAGRFISEDPIGFRGGVNVYAYTLNNPVLYVDLYGLESGNLNKSVPGPNGETAQNVPCPDCLDKMLKLLQKDIQEMQQKAGKPGCVVVCSTVGFADDAVAGGLALWSRRIRTFLGGATGKVVMKTAGICGFGAALIYCSSKCGVFDAPPPPPPMSPLPSWLLPHLPWPKYD
jgi:RHS repeat-associated protein